MMSPRQSVMDGLAYGDSHARDACHQDVIFDQLAHEVVALMPTLIEPLGEFYALVLSLQVQLKNLRHSE